MTSTQFDVNYLPISNVTTEQAAPVALLPTQTPDTAPVEAPTQAPASAPTPQPVKIPSPINTSTPIPPTDIQSKHQAH